MHNLLGQNFLRSHYMYCLQEESIPFSLKVLVIFGRRNQDILSPKNHTRKIDKINKSSNITFLFKNVSSFL